MRARRGAWRKWKSNLGWAAAWLGAAPVLVGLADLFWTVLAKGVASFHFSMLTTVTHGIAGGLQNAILGTFELILLSTAIAAPLGILGGVYVSEFAHTKSAAAVRFLTEVLSGVPSIVIGYFGYLTMVLSFGWGFSALAGGMALAIIMLPYILRTTEVSLEQVPRSQREGAWALGMTRFQAVSRVVWRPAAGGIATGVLTAIAIGMGETAPLLYTAGWSSLNPTWQLTGHQVGYLTYVIWTYIDQPYPEAHALAYSAALLLLGIILIIHLVVRFLVHQSTGSARRHSLASYVRWIRSHASGVSASSAKRASATSTYRIRTR
ncbi:phosphate ABC transporter permease PstA [Alicyclobacillus sp.]|uniref:phosphate ABC transporter permease PstA n=1 Tax=Alicyclobacillus sp. TaxID=61169 RepID=UPI0025BCE800|nr:phosphate ABC transporter permease PstA [Alicyclobacillus sp.]MCL6515881.1 phosphate ABC transporter permease PstA [Alicyclobacillus sp.]